MEARFFVGKALSELGLHDKAKRHWNIVSKEDANGLYGKIAKLELEMLAWRLNQLKPILGSSQL